MAYTDKNAIKAYISGNDIISFLDDDRDGTEDVGLFNAIVTTCSLAADGYVASVYQVPFTDPAPAKIRTATTIFVAEALYARRITPNEVNPFKSMAEQWRKILQKIGEDGTGLDEAFDRAFSPGAAITSATAINRTGM